MPKWPLGIGLVVLILGLALPVLYIHYGLERSSVWLVPIYAVSFVTYFFLFRKTDFTIYQLLAIAVIIRLLLFFGAPALSDDYFRFVWDGQLWGGGVNPYVSTPAELVDSYPTYDSLYSQLNSPNYHSTYPPLSQYIFALPVSLGIQDTYLSMTIIRGVLFWVEIGIMFLLFQLTRRVWSVLLYAFNPLVILELTGNLHFEGVVVFCLLLAYWLYQSQQWKSAAFTLSLGILAKLTPLMYLPLLVKKIGIKKAVWSYVLIGGCLVLWSIPLIDQDILQGLGTGLDLFFRKFEFNAGLFFLVRYLGFWVKGYDVVQTAGPMLSLVALGLILVYALSKVDKGTNWAKAFTVVLSIQLLFATTVHPWYVIPLVALSGLTGYLFPVVWSGLVFLSYTGYSSSGYTHPMFWIGVEYLMVWSLALFELIKDKPLLKNV
ncbi:hypothetical protein N7E81_15670 [Reichenbachiella carrageenanivorans]|uniref:Alpha-1,2-mannosyltransferase n=1 Tax=Reichenbachiella carrageenanivorans TaxID=2979869 RepID=A0ABY6CY10_9BACT|nr:hypothetical protein [Reichenbachiella carrageenanivorans]UXX78797.1 hypothetical protein N7E81_15670 [Reichenbachiella carrageenanivorans]